MFRFILLESESRLLLANFNISTTPKFVKLGEEKKSVFYRLSSKDNVVEFEEEDPANITNIFLIIKKKQMFIA